MIGKLTIDKSSMNLSYFLYTIIIIYEKGGKISRHDFVNEMAKFVGVSAFQNNKENRTAYNKSKLPRYFGFVDIILDEKELNYLVLTHRGRILVDYISDAGDGVAPSERFYISLKHKKDFIDLIFDSVIFDSFGKNNSGAEQSNTDVEPPKVVFKTIQELGNATAEEICYVMFGLNRGEFDSFEEAINKVKDNRSKYIYDYEDIIDEWGITNIVHDCKIINIFTDNNISLLVSERNKDNGKIYYQLSSSLSDVQKEQIKIISAVYEPIKLFAYTHGDKNLIENWIEGSVLGRVSDNSQIIKYDFNLGIEGFCTKKDSSEFMPGAFEKAVLEAYKNEKKNIYLVVTNITESLFFNTISRYTSLLKRIDEVKNLFHGWSAEPLYDEKFYKWLTTKSNRARNILPKDKILLPSNLQIVGTIIMNEENSNTQFDYKFRRCLVDTEKSAVTDDSNMDESLRVTTGENILLYGVPGSGKSWTIQHEYCDDEECMERLVFHPDYMYSDFVGQILPVVKRDDEGKEKVRYEFKPGPFTKILKKAYEDPEKSYYLVIEEINRGNAPAIFGEIFQLLDRMDEDKDGYKKGTSEYGITNENIALEVYGDVDTKVRIPSNLSILGTMNTSDQNVFTLDTAFQRRWIMRMIKNTFSNHKYANKKILDTNVSWKQFCEAINDEILRRNNVTSSEDKRLGAYFVSADDLLHIKTQDNSSEKQKIEAEHKNARFAEKVIKYLWDDAFKFSHPDTFDTRKYKSLEKIIDVFNSSSEDARFDVFHENLRKLILEGVEENNSVSDEDNE